MKTKQFVVLIVVTLIGGVIGGVISDQLGVLGKAVAANDQKPIIIEAQEFRVVDYDGKVFASFKYDPREKAIDRWTRVENAGSTEIRSKSSLVMLSEKGKILWSAP